MRGHRADYIAKEQAHEESSIEDREEDARSLEGWRVDLREFCRVYKKGTTRLASAPTIRIIASGDTSKPANGGHLKTGQRKQAGQGYL